MEGLLSKPQTWNSERKLRRLRADKGPCRATRLPHTVRAAAGFTADRRQDAGIAAGVARAVGGDGATIGAVDGEPAVDRADGGDAVHASVDAGGCAAGVQLKGVGRVSGARAGCAGGLAAPVHAQAIFGTQAPRVEARAAAVRAFAVGAAASARRNDASVRVDCLKAGREQH